MSATSETSVDRFLTGLDKRNPNEPEFLQAVRSFVEHVMPLVDEREELQRAQILERMTEPDRIVIFRVTWQDDEGLDEINEGFDRLNSGECVRQTVVFD